MERSEMMKVWQEIEESLDGHGGTHAGGPRKETESLSRGFHLTFFDRKCEKLVQINPTLSWLTSQPAVAQDTELQFANETQTQAERPRVIGLWKPDKWSWKKKGMNSQKWKDIKDGPHKEKTNEVIPGTDRGWGISAGCKKKKKKRTVGRALVKVRGNRFYEVCKKVWLTSVAQAFC